MNAQMIIMLIHLATNLQIKDHFDLKEHFTLKSPYKLIPAGDTNLVVCGVFLLEK